ncbi:MAG TPA: hypothetical protein VG845_09520 [Dehalococcoidia bacterium]|jgi:hypothetical protein|nr:hypothetical protein [Dehalococcoidia bacterium]
MSSPISRKTLPLVIDGIIAVTVAARYRASRRRVSDESEDRNVA